MNPSMQFQGSGGINGQTMGQNNTGFYNTRGKYETGWDTIVNLTGTQPRVSKFFSLHNPKYYGMNEMRLSMLRVTSGNLTFSRCAAHACS